MTKGQDTFVRKTKEKQAFLLYFAHLFVSLQALSGKNKHIVQNGKRQSDFRVD
jgi:hypothetical protein